MAILLIAERRVTMEANYRQRGEACALRAKRAGAASEIKMEWVALGAAWYDLAREAAKMQRLVATGSGSLTQIESAIKKLQDSIKKT